MNKIRISLRHGLVVCVALTMAPALLVLARSGAPLSRAAYLPAIANQPAPTASPAPLPTAMPTPTPIDIGSEFVVLNLINQTRAANGLPALNRVPELMQSASRHSRDMAANNLTSHTGSDGSTAGQRIRAAGYNWTWSAEIIGWGFTTPDQMMTWWMNSPIHRSMILSPNFADFGSGYTRTSTGYKHYWVVNFGKRVALPRTNSSAEYTCAYTQGDDAVGSSLIMHSDVPCK